MALRALARSEPICSYLGDLLSVILGNTLNDIYIVKEHRVLCLLRWHFLNIDEGRRRRMSG